MTVSPPSHTFTPAQAAKLIETAPHNVRRWCEWHADHLNESANPGQDKPRRLTERDVEVLKTVKALRDQGLHTLTINEQLSQLTFAVVDTEPDPTLTAPLQINQDTARGGLNPLQEGQATPATALQVAEALSTILSPLEARIIKLETRRFDVQSFAVGVIVGLLFVLVFIGVAWVFASR